MKKHQESNITSSKEGKDSNYQLLLHAVEGINRTFELKDLLKKCMHATSIVMNAEASSLMLVDEFTGDLNVSIPTGPVQDDIIGLTIPKDKGVGGWVIQNNTPYVCNDISKSDLFWKDLSDDFKTKNIICVPLQDENGEAFGVLQAINRKEGGTFDDGDVYVFETLAEHVSIAIERARRYDKLVYKLDEKSMQLSELHHRLKNNLATISALIELELQESGKENQEDILKATNSRIKSVANVHTILYSSEDSGKITLKEYLQSILQNVSLIYQENQREIRLKYEVEDITLDTNRAMLCGLIVNELAINAYKHAFAKRKHGEIDINVRLVANERLIMEVRDNGVGMPTDDRGPNTLFIVKALSQKLGADVKKESEEGKGTTFRIEFAL